MKKTYGPGSFKTLWNNCEIVIALPGQKGPDILALLERSMGRKSYVAENRSGTFSSTDDTFKGLSLSEDAGPLFDEDEIRRSDKGILFIRGNRPMLVDVPAYAALDPIRDVAEINPFHGKPFMQPVEAWFDHSTNWSLKRIAFMLTRFWKRIANAHIRIDPAVRKSRLRRRALALRLLAILCNFWWVGAGLYLYAYTDIHLRLWFALTGGL